MNVMNRGWKFAMGASVILALSGVAAGQNAQPKEDDALKGPAVKEDAPGTRKFAQKGPQRGEPQVQIRAFMRALDVIRGEKAADAVRLTSEQDTQIKAVTEGFQSDIAKFREAHGEEVRGLLAKLTPEDRRKAMQYIAPVMGGPGQRPEGKPGEKGAPGERPQRKKQSDAQAPGDDGMQTTDAATSEAAKDQLKKLLANAPKPADTQAKLWTVLTDAQKPVVQKELERIQKEAGKKDKKGGDQATPGEDPVMNNPRLPAELKEKLKDMSPEQRREAIRKWREERQKEKAPSKGGDKKAPPGMDEVEVPSMDDPK
ncbi:MAG: hypothetical protein ACOYN0_02520 [Phycisphaerales bacterium]